MKRDDLIFKDECYQIIGILISIYKELGGTLLEKHYQKAIAVAFKKAGIKFIEQALVKLNYKDSIIGTFFIDFVVEINGNKIILEIKKHENFSPNNIQQVSNYLKAMNLKLGILANFTKSGVKFKRIVNLH